MHSTKQRSINNSTETVKLIYGGAAQEALFAGRREAKCQKACIFDTAVRLSKRTVLFEHK
jgi:hypothetical protein